MECPICIEHYSINSGSICQQCGYRLCLVCTFKIKNTCPNCRAGKFVMIGKSSGGTSVPTRPKPAVPGPPPPMLSPHPAPVLPTEKTDGQRCVCREIRFNIKSGPEVLCGYKGPHKCICRGKYYPKDGFSGLLCSWGLYGLSHPGNVTAIHMHDPSRLGWKYDPISKSRFCLATEHKCVCEKDITHGHMRIDIVDKVCRANTHKYKQGSYDKYYYEREADRVDNMCSVQ